MAAAAPPGDGNGGLVRGGGEAVIDEAVGNGDVGGDDLQAGAMAVQLRAGDGQAGGNIVILGFGIVDGDGVAGGAHEAAALELDVEVARSDILAGILAVHLRGKQEGRAFGGGAAVFRLVFVPVARAGDDRWSLMVMVPILASMAVPPVTVALPPMVRVPSMASRWP